MRHAIVDIGSNTIRLIVFDIKENSKNFKKVLNKKWTLFRPLLQLHLEI